MNFAEIQEDVAQTDIGYTLGQLKTSNPDGKIRMAQASRVMWATEHYSLAD